MPQSATDDTQVEDSSSSTTSESEFSVDGKEESSSNSNQQSGQPKNLSEAIRAAFKESQSARDTETSNKSKDAEVENQDSTEDPNKESEEESEETTEETETETETETEESPDEESEESEEEEGKEKETSQDKDKDKEKGKEKGPVPYSRFEEVNKAKNQLEQQVTEFKHHAEQYLSIANYLQENGVPPDRFHYWLDVAAAAENDPTELHKLLSPYFQAWQETKGDVLTPELQEAVDEGKISPEWAKKYMATQGEAKLKSQQAERAKKFSTQRQQQQIMYEMTNGLANWDSSMRTKDPDFKPKSSPEGVDGKYEVFLAKFAAATREAKVTSVQDALTIANDVYKQVDAIFKPLRPPKTVVKKGLKSTNSTRPAFNSQPKTVGEAVRMAARKHGLNV